MRYPAFSLVILAPLVVTACSDGSSPGSGNGDRTAAQFEQLADSMAGVGDFGRAEALRHAAMVVRLTGDPTPVTLTIDGAPRAFVAIAEELEYPNIVCRWPAETTVVFPDSGVATPPDTAPAPPVPGFCEPQGSTRMRTLIAWEPTQLAEVVRLVASEGSGVVAQGTPDAMAGPMHAGESWGGTGMTGGSPMPPLPGDSGIAPPPPGPAPAPGFMGEYMQRDQGLWISLSGTQANALESEGGSCTSDVVEFDWARYGCGAIRVRFEFTMQVQKLVMIPTGMFPPRDSVPLQPPTETREIGMSPASIAGARLSLLEWLPPPVTPPMPGPLPRPGPMPVPGDSGTSSPGMPHG
jgi:hypothetical protein